jgi:methylene-fatty-acyl-phospholipid synthase
MSHRVTSFPFNVLEDPMYVGSTMAFLGTAIWCESPAGLALSALVWVIYAIALKYEGPFTGMIYERAAEAKAKRAAEAGVPAPSTPPRKSERIAEATATATAATAAPAATNGVAATPRRRAAGRKSAIANETLAASPMRVTRSRSKARSDAEGSE